MTVPTESHASGNRQSQSHTDIFQEAAEWHVLMSSGEANEHDRCEFEAWRQNQSNARAYAELDEVWHRFDTAATPPAREALKFSLQESATKLSGSGKDFGSKNAGMVCGSFLVLLVCSALFIQFPGSGNTGISLVRYLAPGYWLSDYRTDIGESKVIELSDHTKVVLNTFTAIEVNYDNDRRSIRLLQGEIELDVAHDPDRPLTVISHHGRATALGTRYSVYDQGDSMEVIVTESHVRVCAEQDARSARCQNLGPGQATSVKDKQVGLPVAMDADFEHDWQANQLVVNDQPLIEVLDELSRYRLDKLQIDRKSLSEYRVSGVFPLNDTDRALAVLEESLPIDIKHYTPLLTVIAKHEPEKK